MAVYLVPGIFGAGGQILDNNGKTAPGALVNTYAAGTTSPVATFTTSAGNVTAANPIVCAADGRLTNEMWQTQGQAIKILLTDSLANTLGTYDYLYGIGDPAAPNAPTGYFSLTGIGGTANAITAASSAGLASLAIGQLFTFIPIFTNTSTVTLNITPASGVALGAKNVFSSGTALVGGELVINVPVVLEYDGTRLNIIGISKSYYYSISSVGGTANTITATGPSNLSVLASGQVFTMVPISVNTGPTTLNITPSGLTSLGAKNIFVGGAALAGSEFVTNAPVILYYDGTQFNSFVKPPPLVASQAQQEAGTALTVFTAPGVQQFHPSSAKSWIRFNGVTPITVGASYNVLSLSRSATAAYTLSFITSNSVGEYCILGTCKFFNDSANNAAIFCPGSVTVSNYFIETTDTAGTRAEAQVVSSATFGDQP